MAAYDIEYPQRLPAEEYEVGLVVPVWNRPRYLRRFLRSLEKSDLQKTLIVMVDDGSTDATTRELFDAFTHSQAPVIKCRKRRHEEFKIHENLKFGWDMLADVYACSYLTNIDPDMVMRPDWLTRVRELHRRESEKRGLIIVSGFNKYAGITLETGPNYNVRRFMGGAHMFFGIETYRRVMRDEMRVFWDEFVVEAMYERGYACLTTRPSCMQHTGRRGLFSKVWKYDMAVDYSLLSRLYLPARLLLLRQSFTDDETIYKMACRGNSAIGRVRSSRTRYNDRSG